MAKLIFSLRDVPEAEAEEVRALLAEHDFEVYETRAGRWNIAVPAIWVRNDGDYAPARALIDEYQKTLYQREHNSSQQGPFQALLQRPLLSAIYLLAVVIVLALSTVPFFRFF